MRPALKLAAPVVAVSLALSACGTKGSDSKGDSASGGGGKCKDVAIAFFGALTGDAANLGINMKNGAQLAVEEHNAKHPDCTVELQSIDSEGDPAKAPALAQQAVKNKKLVGIVGPGFSGESKAVDPIFEQAGMPTVTASATNPKLAENGWKTFHRLLGNDATQGPAAAKYIKDTLKADKVFVVDDSSEYGKGLADLTRQDLGSAVVGSDQIQQKKTDFSGTVTKISSSGASAVFFGGYYAEAAILVKQLRSAGWKGTFVSADGVKDQGYIDAAKDSAEGTVVTCPCLPPDKAPQFAAAYKKKFNVDPGTYSAEAYDAANALLAAIDAGKTKPEDVNTFLKTINQPGVTKTIKFTDKGEPAEVSVWAYKVTGGKIVADKEIK